MNPPAPTVFMAEASQACQRASTTTMRLNGPRLCWLADATGGGRVGRKLGAGFTKVFPRLGGFNFPGVPILMPRAQTMSSLSISPCLPISAFNCQFVEICAACLGWNRQPRALNPERSRQQHRSETGRRTLLKIFILNLRAPRPPR